MLIQAESGDVVLVSERQTIDEGTGDVSIVFKAYIDCSRSGLSNPALRL